MERCTSEGACPSGESLPNIDSAAEDAMTAGDAPVTAGAAFTEEDDALVLTFGNFFDEEGALEAAEDAAPMNSIPGCNL